MRKLLGVLCLCSLLIMSGMTAASAWQRLLYYNFEDGWAQAFSNSRAAEEVTYQESNFSVRVGPQSRQVLSSGKDISNIAVTEKTYIGVAYYPAAPAEVTFRVVLTDTNGKNYSWENKPSASFRWYHLEDEAGEKRVLLTNFKEVGTGAALQPGATIRRITFEQEALAEIEQTLYFDEVVIWRDDDTQAPSKVGGLLAYREDGSVRLQWNRASDNTGVVLYEIYRGTSPEQIALVGQTNELVFRDTTAAKTETHYYRVLAVDHSGNTGELSDPIVVWKDDTEAPPKPEGLLAIPFAWGNSVRLEWLGVTLADVDDLAGYRVYRQEEGRTEHVVTAFVPAQAEPVYSLEEYALENNRLYVYKVVAVDTSGNESEPVTAECTPKIVDPVVARFDFEDGQSQGWTANSNYAVVREGHNGSKYASFAAAYNTSNYNLQFRRPNTNFGLNPETKIAFAYKVKSDFSITYMRVVLEDINGKRYIKNFPGELDKWVAVQFNLAEFATEAGGVIPLGTRIRRVDIWARRNDGVGNQEFMLDNVVIYNGTDRLPPALCPQPEVREDGTDIVVTWQIPEDNVGVAGFNIYRGIGDVTPHPSLKLNPTLYCDSNTYIDIGAAGVPYRYLIEVVDFSGNVSYSTVSEPAEGVDTIPPNAPVVFGKSEVRGKVELSWQEPPPASDGELPLYYKIYRSESISDLTERRNLVANHLAATKWTGITGMVPGKEYYFLVTSVDSKGNENLEGEPVRIKVAAEDSPASSKNMVLNPSAEEGDGNVINWGTGTMQGSPIYSWDHTTAVEGAKSLRISGTASDRGNRSTRIYDLVAGKFYKLSGYYKAEGLSRPDSGLVFRVMIDEQGAAPGVHLNYTLYDNLNPSKYWQRMERTFVAPEKSSFLDLNLFLWLTEGTMWFDNIELVELPLLLGPAHGSRAGSCPTLRWEEVQIYQYSGPLSYNLQYSQDPTFQDETTVTVTDIQKAEYTIPTVLEPGRWYWRVSINTDPTQYPKDSSGQAQQYSSPSPYSQARFFDVGTGPQAPVGVQVSTETKGVLTISWQGSSSAAGYRIYRGTESGFPLNAETVLADFVKGTSFVDYQVEPGVEYFYRICALDEYETEGSPSWEMSAVPLADNTPPEKIDSFEADASLAGKIILTWNAPGAAEDGDLPVAYRVYRRKQGDDVFVLIGETDETTFTDHAVESEETYEYCVTSLDKVGNESTPSAAKEATAASVQLRIEHDPVAMAGMGKNTDFVLNITGNIEPSEVLLCYGYGEQVEYFELPMKKQNDSSWQLTISMPQVESFSYFFKIKHGESVFLYPQDGAENPLLIKTITGFPSGNLQILDLRILPAVFDPGKGVLSIAYLLGQDASTTVGIYSLSGQRVRTLGSTNPGEEGSRAGVNILTWDGRDEQGRLVRNGPYLVSVIARDGRAETKAHKLVVVLKEKGGI